MTTRHTTALDVIEGAARWTTLVGDVRETLRAVPDACVQTCVTSPPYYGLRDYGTATWEGGDSACLHRVRERSGVESSTLGGGKAATGHQQEGFRGACPRCGARRVDAQIGLEQSPAEYVAAMVGVMRDVRRVLREDGTLWLNIGDSYASGTKGSGGRGKSGLLRDGRNEAARIKTADGSIDHQSFAPRRFNHDVKPKDLLGIPWRLAFALQDDGWFLRSDIVWAKPNPMPESVTDRPTRAHEYVFLLTKRARYFYDGAAIREPVAASTLRDARIGTDRVRDIEGAARDFGAGTSASRRNATNAVGSVVGRNARDVWTITPEPFAEAHFATMPPELARRCILAGSRKGDVVLDPFGGAGTTALVALQHGRRALLCELNPAYVELQRKRLADFDADAVSPLVGGDDFGPLFGGGR